MRQHLQRRYYYIRARVSIKRLLPHNTQQFQYLFIFACYAAFFFSVLVVPLASACGAISKLQPPICPSQQPAMANNLQRRRCCNITTPEGHSSELVYIVTFKNSGAQTKTSFNTLSVTMIKQGRNRYINHLQWLGIVGSVGTLRPKLLY